RAGSAGSGGRPVSGCSSRCHGSRPGGGLRHTRRGRGAPDRRPGQHGRRGGRADDEAGGPGTRCGLAPHLRHQPGRCLSLHARRGAGDESAEIGRDRQHLLRGRPIVQPDRHPGLRQRESRAHRVHPADGGRAGTVWHPRELHRAGVYSLQSRNRKAVGSHGRGRPATICRIDRAAPAGHGRRDRARSRLLRLPDPDPEEIPCITHSFAVSTPRDGIAAEAVAVGEGPPAGTVSGCVAIVDGLATPDDVAKLQSDGAVGVIFLNRDPLVHEMIVSTIWGSPTLSQLGRLPSIPVVSAAGDGAVRVRARAAGGRRVRVRLTTAVQTGWRRLPLLVAEADGTGDDTFVLLAGHVDSWHYGAMDNGGANAVMMEAGRLLARTRLYRGLRLTFWSGHSHGRYAGSAWYVDSHWDELNARCAAHLNVDSVGGRGATKLDAGYCMPETREVGVRVVGALAGQQYRGTRVGRSGEQSFLGIGVPSLFMSLSEHPADGPEAS